MILIPLPSYGFDPTEAAVPWKFLKEKKVEIVFSTPNGLVAEADQRLITGEGFGIFKKVLMADKEAREYYDEMINSDEFNAPIPYNQIKIEDIDGILLPGGHDKGMREYLESINLQEVVSECFRKNKLVGAICHGTVLACRSIDKETNNSVLYTYQTTALLKRQELGAYMLTCLWLKDYYRTYKETVQTEVKSRLKKPKQFKSGTFSLNRDSWEDQSNAFVLKDRNYISARWPGDARTFAKTYYTQLIKTK